MHVCVHGYAYIHVSMHTHMLVSWKRTGGVVLLVYESWGLTRGWEASTFSFWNTLLAQLSGFSKPAALLSVPLPCGSAFASGGLIRKCPKRTQATPLLLKHFHLDLENRTWWSASSDGCPNTGLDDITLRPKVGEGTHHRAASKRQCPNSTFLATLPPLSPATQNIGCPKQMIMAKHTCAPHPNA